MLNNEETTNILFWKRKLGEIGRKGAILVLTKDDEDILSTIAEYVPFFMKKNGYISLRIVSDVEERIERFLKHVNIPCETEVVPTEYYDCMFRLENAFGIFGRIYSDVSDPMEDGDFYELIGYDNITLRDIVSYVILRLDHIPTKEEIEEGREWLFDNKKYEDVFAKVRSLTGRYEKTVDKDLAERQKEIIEKEVKLEGKNIYLYGDSGYAKVCLEVYNGYNIVGIIDIDKDKVGQQRKGITIYSLDKIKDLDLLTDVVLVTNRRYEDVFQKLSLQGGVYNKTFFILNPKPDAIDFMNDEFEKYLSDEISKGENVFSKWRGVYKEEKLLLSPWNASGDIYVAGLYLKDYIDKNCPNGYCIFVTSGAAKKVALLLGYDTELIPQEDMDSMLLYVRYIGFEQANSLNTNVNYPNSLGVQRIAELFRILDFNTAHQRMAFRSDIKQTKLELKQKNSDEYFEKYHLKKGKTVLLVPYSNTLGSIPEEYSLDFVSCLMERGYSVCTNVAGDEKPIEGTVRLFLPYDVVLDFVNKAGGVIGIRCGLFDIVSTSEAKMAVYYWKSHQSLFSLKHMGIKTDNYLEMNTTDNSWPEIVDKTLRFFD